MTVWRYEAIESTLTAPEAGPRARRSGELAGATEADVRAALRRIGLQVIDVRPTRRVRAASGSSWPSSHVMSDAWRGVLDAAHRRQRRRRRPARAQLYDSLGTMVRSGIPLLDAVETLSGGSARSSRGGRAQRTMLLQVRESLRSGGSIASAMREHAGWFDPVETAMVEAGQHAGTLPQVMETLAERHEQESRLAQRLAGALIYPSIVAVAGVGVTMFLSVRTLPELVRILEGAKVPAPALTVWVMSAGQAVARWGWLATLVVAAVAVGCVPALALLRRAGLLPRMPQAPTPRVVRAMAVADFSIRLGELVRTGVPVTESLRVLAPSTRPGLRRVLVEAAGRVERGEEVGQALRECGGRWFDEEFLRLIEVAQASGELDSMLDRIGRRYEREARRSIDRLATLMEPAVIVLLAVLVGTVVMAAVLPLARMKDVI